MFKNIPWGQMIIIFAIVVVGGVVAQMLVTEEVGEDGKPVKKLAIGGKKD